MFIVFVVLFRLFFVSLMKAYEISACLVCSEQNIAYEMLRSFFFQAEDGIRGFCLSRGIGDVYEGQVDHYCRSWELLGMNNYGPIVNIEKSNPPYKNTRRLVTDYDVGNDRGKAHSGVLPRKYSPKTKNGKYTHAAVWKYLFTHPVDQVGTSMTPDDSSLKVHTQ